MRVARDGSVSEIAAFGMKWVERVASFADGKTQLRACAVGKQVHLFDAVGTKLKALNHPSTVTGLVFDARGKRVAASHYNGASLWFVASKSDNPRVLEWKGSHTAIAISPDGDAVVTAMQEKALHGWRLSDGQHMRMSGYPGKTEALSASPAAASGWRVPGRKRSCSGRSAAAGRPARRRWNSPGRTASCARPSPATRSTRRWPPGSRTGW